MKKLFFAAATCISVLLLAGCSMNCAEDAEPSPNNDSHDKQDDWRKGEQWVDTLRPPLSPYVISTMSQKHKNTIGLDPKSANN